MPRQVLKFGGTSVGSYQSLQQVAQIILDKSQTKELIVVVSAMNQVTDQLLLLAKSAKRSSLDTQIYDQIVQRHRQVLQDFGFNLGQSRLKTLFAELWEVLTYQTLIEETSELAYLDLISSFGERLSGTLLTELLQKAGLEAQFVDARDFLVTDATFQKATLNWQKSRHNWCQLEPKLAKILVLTGFIGRSETASTTTLGRGGSDLTAGVMANLVDAKTVEIWTDVDGILSTDPRSVPEAKLVPQISYSEAFEVASFGGKVLYPQTIEAILPKKIEILIKNTWAPQRAGTSITNEQTDGLKVVSLATKITLVEIVFASRTSEIGLLAYIFAEFAKVGLTIDVVTTSGDSVAFSCDKVPKSNLIQKIESELGPVSVWENQEIVATIGTNLNQQSIFGRILEFIAQTSPKMISLNTKNTNLTAVVDQGQGAILVQKIHNLLV